MYVISNANMMNNKNLLIPPERGPAESGAAERGPADKGAADSGLAVKPAQPPAPE